jgi:solute carrier family 25 (adenine nucleotide translocator) protein 4/5/6/31
MQQQQHQRHHDDADHDDDDMMNDQPITLGALAMYSLRNYVFSLIGDMTSKLFVAPLERYNVVAQTQAEVRACGMRRELGGLSTAPRSILDMGIGSTVWNGLVFQLYRTTFRCATSSLFYILEAQAASRVAALSGPNYFFYVRPVAIDLLNLACVYGVDTAATMNMADESAQPALREGTSGLVVKVLSSPRDSLRGFGVTALGLIAYRWSLAAATNILVSTDSIPRSPLNRFLLQNAVLFACTTAVYPFDTVRRRMIVRAAFKKARTTSSSPAPAAAAGSATSSSSATAGAAAAASDDGDESTLQCIKRIYSEEGVKGFFSGIEVRLARMVGGAFFYGFIQYLEMRAAAME